jgi:hypothetical protein
MNQDYSSCHIPCLIRIIMSYPRLLYNRLTERCVIFTVPGYSVIEKIKLDRDQERDLRVQVGARALSDGISELASLLSLNNSEIISTHGHSALKVKLYTNSIMFPTTASIVSTRTFIRRQVRVELGQLKVHDQSPRTGLFTIKEEAADLFGDLIE